MVIPLKVAREKYYFEPKLSYNDIDYGLNFHSIKNLGNSKLHRLFCKITGAAYPTHEERFDKNWEYFYLPVRRQGKFITVPFGIYSYKSIYSCIPHLSGVLELQKGNDYVDEIIFEIFNEVLRFIPVIKKHGRPFIEKTVPYDIRVGKIKGKYIMDKVITKDKKEKLMRSYQRHLETQKEVHGITLDDYLTTAGICYNRAYGKKTKGLKPEEMYKKWADGRDAGMLSIKNLRSKNAFSKWYHNRIRGGHPFEIVFSWRRHGIHLYPPREDHLYYSLRVTNLGYAPDFIKMVRALIGHGVSFQANDLAEVVEYLSGETDFKVNEWGDSMFHYKPSLEYKRKYFKHVEWEELKLPRWK